MQIKEFDFVEIIVPTGKEFNDDRVGEVTHVDGCYIMVKRNISGVEIQLYPHEMRLLEGNDSDVAYFNRNMWRGLKPNDENYDWLAAGYLREVDWEAAQEENVTANFEFVDVSLVEHPTDPDAFLPGKKPNELLRMINELSEEIAERQYREVHEMLDKLVENKKYDDAMKVVK